MPKATTTDKNEAPENKPETAPTVDPQAQQIASLTEMVNRLQGKLDELQAAPQAPAIPQELVIEDGPCETKNYFSPKIAELQFTVSVGGKVKDSKGNMVDPIPEVFRFHNGVMSLNTKKRIFLAENYGPFKKVFWPTTAVVAPVNKTEYVTGPATAGGAKESKVQ